MCSCVYRCRYFKPKASSVMKKQMPTPTLLLAYVALAALTFTACKKETNNGPNPNQEEVITTLRVALTDSATSAVTTFRFYDLDGDGGAQATVDTIRLRPNTRYFASLTLLDESTNPAGDVTEEIREEENDHQFFFTTTNPTFSVTYDTADYDSNNPPKPVGLQTKWLSGNAQRTSVRIILKHQPAIKSTITNPLGDVTRGDTDVDLTFPVVVE